MRRYVSYTTHRMVFWHSPWVLSVVETLLYEPDAVIWHSPLEEARYDAENN